MVEINNQDNLIEFKVSNDLLKSSKKAVPSFKQAYPSPYVPVETGLGDITKEGYPYVTGKLGSSIDNINYPWNFTPNNVPVINYNDIQLPNPSGEHIGYLEFMKILYNLILTQVNFHQLNKE